MALYNGALCQGDLTETRLESSGKRNAHMDISPVDNDLLIQYIAIHNARNLSNLGCHLRNGRLLVS